MQVSRLEDRTLLSTINWTNRADLNANGFNTFYGGDAVTAQSIVDRAIADWETMIVNFNYQNVGTPGNAAVANTYNINVSAASISGRGVTSGIAYDGNNRPLSGTIQLDDDGGGAGWFFDATPQDDAEFTDLVTRFSSDTPASPGVADFYRTIVHELGHAMGLASTAPRVTGAEVNLGPDPINNAETLRRVTTGGVNYYLTTDGGRHFHETYHPDDLLNDGRTYPGDRRQLITDTDAQFLESLYGYTALTPSKVNTFLVNPNSSTGVLTINAEPGATSNNFALMRVGGSLQVGVNGSSELVPIGSFSSIVVLGAGVSDNLILDFAGGAFLPGGGLDFQAGGGSDAITLNNGGFGNVSYNFTSASTGTIALDGDVVSFSGLEPVFDNLNVFNRVFTYAAANSVTLGDDPGGPLNNLSQISSDAGETVNFVNPIVSLTVNSGPGILTGVRVSADAVDFGLTAPINLNGGIDVDTFLIAQTRGPLTINAGGAADAVVLGFGFQDLSAIRGPVVVDGQAGGTSLTLDDRAFPGSRSYVLDATSVTSDGGFGGVTFSNINSLTLHGSNVAAAGSSFTIRDTIAGTTTVNGTPGEDRFDIFGVSGNTTLNGGDGNDTFNLFSAPDAGVTLQINGDAPPITAAPNGDVLVLFVSELSVWNLKATPNDLKFGFAGLGNVSINSIERIDARATTVNLVGDNNDPGLDQPDTYVVRGTSVRAATVSLNGSIPLNLTNLSFLNAFGDDQNPPPGTPSTPPNDVDTLDIQPYADNTPVGWGVAVSFDEGNPVLDGTQADLLIYNGVNGVSEDLVVRPSALQAGQLVATQGLTGVPIVIINFVANTDLRFQGANIAGAADTDTLTLSGSLAQQPGIAIDQAVIADFGAAGNAAAPKIIVNNPAAAPFYRVQNFTNFSSLTIDLGAGNDSLSLAGTAGADTFGVTGSGPSSADISVALAAIPTVLVHGRSIESVVLSPAGAGDTLNLNGDGGDNAFTMTDTTAQVDAGPVVTYTGVTTINLAAGGGADALTYTGASAAYTLNGGVSPATLATGTVTTSLGGIDSLTFRGNGAADTLTVTGTAANETFNVTSTATGEAALTTSLGNLAVTANNLTGYVLQGGAGGFDQVILSGTNGTDTASSTATVVTFNGVTVDIASAIDRIEIGTFAGVDSVTLGLTVAGLAVFVDAGADNDTVNLTATTIPTTILGGNGDDTLVGGTNIDRIEGGSGNDSARGGVGNDQFFGGDGSDTFTWNPGDNNDLVEGEGGQNILVFNGADAVNDTFIMSANGTRLRFDRSPGGVVIDAAGIQQVNANTGSGNDSVTINNLADTEVKVINVTLGALATPFTPDGVRDSVVINGRQSSNEISLTVQQVSGQAAGVTQVDVEGLAQHIFLGGTVAACPVVATDDVLTVNGGIGNDHIAAAQGVELKIGMTINGGDGDDYVRANATINGGAGNDTLLGAGGDCGLTIDGGDGNDQICGNEGGNDTLNGGNGNDSIYGLGGDDSILGGAGNDFLAGNDGADVIAGEDGNDTILGGAGDDSLDGNAGNDLMLGDADADCGSTTVVLIDAGQGNDTLNGGDGNDRLNGDLGDDVLNGDDGEDVLGPVDIYASANLPVVVTPGSATAPFTVLIGHFTDAGDDTMDGGAGNDTITGDTGDDSLIGNTGDDSIYGNEGNDTITGNDGNDSIWGGAGQDLISGDADNDLIYGDAGNDTITGNDGDDSIYGGTGDDSIQGNAGNDLVYGDDGNDSVEGGTGNDSIYGGAGNDQLCGNEDDDLVSGDAGDDVALGNEGNDKVLGGDGADQLWGGIGNDSIDGGAGNDSIVGGDGNDSILGGDGDDLLFGQAGDDTILGGFGNDAIYGGDGNDYLLGGTYDTANTLHAVRPPAYPSDGDDLVSGGAGFDRVDGGNGNNLLDAGDDGIRETLLGGRGNDYAFTHHNHDAYKDLAALDGGHNRVFKDPAGSITDPPVPDEVCAVVVFAAPTLPVLHGQVIQPGAVLKPSGTPPAPFPVNGVKVTKAAAKPVQTPKAPVKPVKPVKTIVTPVKKTVKYGPTPFSSLFAQKASIPGAKAKVTAKR